MQERRKTFVKIICRKNLQRRHVNLDTVILKRFRLVVMAGYCEHGNEHSLSTKFTEFVERQDLAASQALCSMNKVVLVFFKDMNL